MDSELSFLPGKNIIIPSVPTPHNNAKQGEIAEVVILCGDPLRAKFIAENYMTNVEEVNNVRNMLAFTGYYKEKRLTVMGSGMGVASFSIYAYELYTAYNVKRIIRAGTCGGFFEEMNTGSIVLAQSACYEPGFIEQYRLPGVYSTCASFSLLKIAAEYAEDKEFEFRVGNVLTSNSFYNDGNDALAWRKLNVLCVEMETAALYTLAARLGKEALSILAISDNIVAPGKILTSEQRQKYLSGLFTLALYVATSD